MLGNYGQNSNIFTWHLLPAQLLCRPVKGSATKYCTWQQMWLQNTCDKDKNVMEGKC